MLRLLAAWLILGTDTLQYPIAEAHKDAFEVAISDLALRRRGREAVRNSGALAVDELLDHYERKQMPGEDPDI